MIHRALPFHIELADENEDLERLFLYHDDRS
jgi:hypothetical protein